MPANKKIVAIDACNGNEPINVAPRQHASKKPASSAWALVSSNRLGTRSSCNYSSPLGLSLGFGTISIGLSSLVTPSLIAPEPWLYQWTPWANILPVMLRASGGGPALA